MNNIHFINYSNNLIILQIKNMKKLILLYFDDTFYCNSIYFTQEIFIIVIIIQDWKKSSIIDIKKLNAKNDLIFFQKIEKYSNIVTIHNKIQYIITIVIKLKILI